MADPLTITASVVGITTAAIGSLKFLHSTISDIKDVPTALENVRLDLEAVEAVLQQLRMELEKDDSQMLLIDDIRGAVKDCNSACSAFQKRLEHWMRHTPRPKAFWAEWNNRFKVGLFEQGTIKVFKGRLSDCESTLIMVLSTSSVIAVTRQGFMMEEVKDSMLKSNESRLEEEEARANRELAATENFLEQLSVHIQNEVDVASKQDLGQLLEETQEQKASNEAFRKTCEKAISQTKNIHVGIEQEIRNTKADNNSRAVAGLINTPGEMRNIKQKISDTSASGGSFAGAGVVQGVELSIPGLKN